MRGRRILIPLSVVLLVTFTGFLLYKFFTVRHITVIGNKNLTEREVKAQIGVKEGDFLLYPTSKEIYERLKKLSWIKEASVRKELSGNLILYISEATPVAVLEMEQRKFLVSEEGSILEEIRYRAVESEVFLPIIRQIDPFRNKEALTESVRLLIFLKNKGLIRADDEVLLTGETADTLTVRINGFPIIFGRGDYEAKLTKYLMILAEIQRRGMKLQYVDLRVPDRVIVKPLE